MANGDQLTNWNELKVAEAYRLSQAEFKGATIQALQDIRADINELKSYNTNSRYIALMVSGISGVLSGLFGKNLLR